MPLTKSITFKFQVGGLPRDVIVEKSADGVSEFTGSIAGEATDTEIELAIRVAGLELLIISSDVALTIETNSGSAADDTLAIAAGVPFIWVKDAGIDNPLGTNVTSLFVTNGTSDAANLDIVVCQDTTP